MTQQPYIPHTPKLRAEQVESWANQAASWGKGPDRGITSHHSANLILNEVEDTEKPAIRAAWTKGYRDGLYSR